MDTFAAMALASIPPSADVMSEKPRDPGDFIITKGMKYIILGIGFAFLLVLMGLMYQMREEGMRGLTIFFTAFVMLQFWNLFNVSVLGTRQSVFKATGHAWGLLGVASVILIGQIIIVNFGGDIFRTIPLSIQDWLYIVVGTSVVLWIGEIWRLISRLILKWRGRR